MKHLYPSMTELRAFSSSARQLSFSRAAKELNLTPSAVSRQIAKLEANLGVTLFVHDGRQLTLTPSGQLYLQRIAGPLSEIGAAALELLASRAASDLLTIASVPTFTTKYLIPRLPDFLAATPGVTISFSQHLAHGDPFPLNLDAAIRYGNGKWEGVVSDYIDGRLFTMVCSPDLRARHRLQRPQDVAGLPRLLHSQAEDVWHQWAQQYAVPDMLVRAGSRFEQYAVLIQAAQAGLGLALIPAFLVRDNLRAGTLVEPLATPIEVDHGHYLCYLPERIETRPQLKRFRDWLLAQATLS